MNGLLIHTVVDKDLDEFKDEEHSDSDEEFSEGEYKPPSEQTATQEEDSKREYKPSLEETATKKWNGNSESEPLLEELAIQVQEDEMTCLPTMPKHYMQRLHTELLSKIILGVGINWHH